MAKIKLESSSIQESQLIEWLEEQIDTDIIEITVLQKIHSLNDKASFDCVVYLCNIINYVSEFKIVYFEYQPTKQQICKNCFYKNNTFSHIQMIQNSHQFINDWLKQSEASPFLIKYQIKQHLNINDVSQPKIEQAIEIVNFIKSKISKKHLELLYDETITFINTLQKTIIQ